MAEVPERRCPRCGALVGENADWCGQCFADLRPAGREPVRPPVITELPEPTAWRQSSEAAVSTEVPEVGWPCGACGRRNAVELDVCAFCGTPFGQAYDPPTDRRQVSPETAMRWSLAYPGLGHFRAGRGIEGMSRAVVFTWPLLTGIVFFSARPRGGLGAIGALGIGFLLCALVLYGVSALDARRIAQGRDQVLSSRTLLWFAAALVLLSVVSAALVLGRGIQGVRSG
jgi:hypothetical protein